MTQQTPADESGPSLDQIGLELEVDREFGESDASYAKRLQTIINEEITEHECALGELETMRLEVEPYCGS